MTATMSPMFSITKKFFGGTPGTFGRVAYFVTSEVSCTYVVKCSTSTSRIAGGAACAWAAPLQISNPKEKRLPIFVHSRVLLRRQSRAGRVTNRCCRRSKPGADDRFDWHKIGPHGYGY